MIRDRTDCRSLDAFDEKIIFYIRPQSLYTDAIADKIQDDIRQAIGDNIANTEQHLEPFSVMLSCLGDIEFNLDPDPEADTLYKQFEALCDGYFDETLSPAEIWERRQRLSYTISNVWTIRHKAAQVQLSLPKSVRGDRLDFDQKEELVNDPDSP